MLLVKAWIPADERGVKRARTAASTVDRLGPSGTIVKPGGPPLSEPV
jgi:hypothetical protein